MNTLRLFALHASTANGVVNLTTDVTNAMIDRYMVKTLLRLADKNTVFYKLGNKVSVPKGESKTITFTRWERIRPPRTSLTEGVTPTGTTLSVSRVNATLEQWGSYCTISDVAEMTVRYEPFQRAVELVGLQAAETLDREIQKVLIAGANVFYPNGRTARSSLTSSDTADTPTLRKMRAYLKYNGAPGVSGSDNRKKFIGVCDSFMAADLMSDTTFIESAKFQNLEPLTSGEFGEWQGIRWQESNHIPVLKRTSTVEPSATDWALGSTPSNTTALDAGTYKVAVTGYDAQGFESLFCTTDFGTGALTGSASGSESVSITLSALPTMVTDSGASASITNHAFAGDSTVVAYNIYASATGGSTMYLCGENLPAGTYHLVKASTSGSSLHLVVNTTGRTSPVQPPTNVNVHQAYVFGNEWFSVAEIEGVKVMMTPSGAQKGDELAQRRSVGWKFFLKALITNELFGCRLEAASANE